MSDGVQSCGHAGIGTARQSLRSIGRSFVIDGEVEMSTAAELRHEHQGGFVNKEFVRSRSQRCCFQVVTIVAIDAIHDRVTGVGSQDHRDVTPHEIVMNDGSEINDATGDSERKSMKQRASSLLEGERALESESR